MWIIQEWNAIVHFVIAHSLGIVKLDSWRGIYKTKCTNGSLKYSKGRLATKRIFPQSIFKNLNGDDDVDESKQSCEFANLESYLISLLDLVRVLPLSEQWTQIIIARCF